MKYIFGFNVGCKIYKKFPKINISLNDRLIDELVLDNSHLYNQYNLIDRKRYPDNEFGDKNFIQDSLYSKKINLYTLDDKDLNGKITLDIKNSDSNYTNGFMTNSTLLKFSYVFLIPEFILYKERNNILNKIYSAKKGVLIDDEEHKKLIPKWPLDCTHFLQWYGGDRVLEFTIVNDGIKYKRFDNKIKNSYDEYFKAKYLGIDTDTDGDVWISVRQKFLEIMDKVL